MFDNFRAKIRNYFTKPASTPDPLEDAFNVEDFNMLMSAMDDALLPHEHTATILVKLHLLDMIDAAERKHRPRASLRATLVEVTSELLQIENTMHRHGLAK